MYRIKQFLNKVSVVIFRKTNYLKTHRTSRCLCDTETSNIKAMLSNRGGRVSQSDGGIRSFRRVCSALTRAIVLD